MLNVGDVLDRELVRLTSSKPDEPKVGEHVPLPGWQQATTAPKQPLPRQRNIHPCLSREVHLWHLFRLRRCLKERIVLESEHLRGNFPRELASRGVVLLDSFVVAHPFRGDAI